MWILIGAVVAAAFLAMALWLRKRKISLTWYDWLLGFLGLALLLFALQNFFASMAELEPTAPGMFLLVFGLPALILLAIAFSLPWLRHFLSRRSKSAAGQVNPIP